MRTAKLARRGALAALALSIILASCAEDVKITAPRYALSIGVQNYLNVRKLSYTLSDANSIAQLMSDQGWTAISLLDAYATRAGIVSAIADLAARAESDSTVLIYYSGHGSLLGDGTTSLIAPYDTELYYGTSTAVPSTVISAPQLSSMLSAFSTKNIIVILDCCNSSGFADPGSSIDPIPPLYGQNEGGTAPAPLGIAFSHFGDLLSANGSASGKRSPIVITAAGYLESSYDGTPAMDHGVFTYFLLDAAKNGDTNGDGVVTATEAYEYTAKKIVSDWNAMYSNTMDDGGLFMDFYPHISGGARDLVLFVK